MRRAASRRLRSISAEIEVITQRRVAAWGELAQHPSRASAAQITALSERLTALWAEARAMRACIRHGDHTRILERARSDARMARA